MDRNFARLLLAWNCKENTREMPWKGEKNPYFIWLSEIILQQTRVEQGLPYFVRFKKKYPSVKKLAEAKPDEVMRLWQGLGYYSRARNLHETAKNIQQNYHGVFPDTYVELKKLKGVGEYTASAIASFAFGEKKAVVDGNVIRVLSRVFGIEVPFDIPEGKKRFSEFAQRLINEKYPGEYNQAIMDFGAIVCVPQNPRCNGCPFRKTCFAKNHGKIDELPKRKKKAKVKNRYFNYLVIKNGTNILIRRRTGNDIWKNLYDLPLLETEKPLGQNFRQKISKILGTEKFSVSGSSDIILQQLTHQKIHFRFFHIKTRDFLADRISGARQVKTNLLRKFAFPQTIHLYLEENCLL